MGEKNVQPAFGFTAFFYLLLSFFCVRGRTASLPAFGASVQFDLFSSFFLLQNKERSCLLTSESPPQPFCSDLLFTRSWDDLAFAQCRLSGWEQAHRHGLGLRWNDYRDYMDGELFGNTQTTFVADFHWSGRQALDDDALGGIRMRVD
jgi:hypothetical protein